MDSRQRCELNPTAASVLTIHLRGGDTIPAETPATCMQRLRPILEIFATQWECGIPQSSNVLTACLHHRHDIVSLAFHLFHFRNTHNPHVQSMTISSV